MNKQINLQAPAKINYRIDVIKKRDDGYHELYMIMQRVSLFDDISIELKDNKGISIKCGSKYAPDDERNIAWKAAKAIFDFAKYEGGAAINITKRIPIGAGLGGGSSDAASVLMGLNKLLNLQVDDKKLMEIGLKLGADVPFFIFKKSAIAEGIGEILSETPPLPNASILLINPGIHIPTPWVYKNLQLTKQKELIKLPVSYDSIKDICNILHNDLEDVTIPAHPIIAEIKNNLIENGALGSLMSGSGSTVFAIFDSKIAAEKAEKIVNKDKKWFASVVETI